MVKVDLIVHSAAQLITCASPGGPKRGKSLADVGLIADGALAVSNGLIVGLGSTHEVLADYSGATVIDATGKVICPGFVDPHTHLVYAGERIEEFEMRIQGTTYLEILEAGGGILSTMRATREAPVEALVRQSLPRLDKMLRLGTTTVEIKTGYGLDTVNELKMLRVIEKLYEIHPMDVVPTFLGAHAIPPEYGRRTDDYVDLVVSDMLPAVDEWYQDSLFSQHGIPLFCDIFCEDGAFDLEQSIKVLQSAQTYGMGAKIHAEEFSNVGGSSLAVHLRAVSADHLDVTLDEQIVALASSDVVGVVLPAVNFNLGSSRFAPARHLVDSGVVVALGTDMNPGSAPCLSMPMVMAIGCRYQALLPTETLNAGTINAAHALCLEHRVGSLEVGKQADFLILEAPDYRYLAYEFGSTCVEAVFKAGTSVQPGHSELSQIPK